MDQELGLLDGALLEDREPAPDLTIPTIVLHGLHALLQGRGRSTAAVIRKRRHNFREVLGLAMQGRSFLQFEFTPDGPRVDGTALPPSQEALEISRLLLDAGMTTLLVRGLPEQDELDRFAVLLETHFRRRLQWDADLALYPRLRDACLHHLSFRFCRPRRLGPEPHEFSSVGRGSAHGQDPWEVELEIERTRRLDLEFGLTLLEDLDKDPRDEAWKGKVVEVLARLFEHLVGKRRYGTLVPLLDRALACRALGATGRRSVHRCLDAFRTPDRLGRFLRALSSSSDPSLVEFLVRLGPSIAPFLLAQEEEHGSRTLHDLLRVLVTRDPAPLLALLDSGDVRLEQRALSYLLECEGALPDETLARLAASDVAWIKERASRLVELRERAGPGLDEPTALLHDAQEWIRIQGLRRLRNPEASACGPQLMQWFEARQRSMGFSERREFFSTLAVVDPEGALPFLRRWIDRVGPRRRNSDHDNRLCAIHVLGELPGDEARTLLEKLAENEGDLDREVVLQVLASRHDDRTQ
ncbi:MAG: hypothetical protein R3F30_08625 [Planctomycetota bacterium]